ncbi:thioredoxin [Streptomyces wuyuanensis]|uniref:thioredoxin n=1 Tax=Streptomyces wuyuanensis TaxID=1196353 RepID=UPI00371BC358
MSASPTNTAGRTVVCTDCGRRNRVPAVADGRPRCGSCKSALPWIADAGDDDFAEVAEKAAPVVLVDLWATWCGPCRMVSPALEQVAREMAGRIKLVKVDVDQAPRIAQRFQVQAVPTLVLMDRGEVIARQAGAAPAPALRQWVEQALQGRR